VRLIINRFIFHFQMPLLDVNLERRMKLRFTKYKHFEV